LKDICEALLIAQTTDGYAAATSDLTKFVNKKPDCEFLESGGMTGGSLSSMLSHLKMDPK
jgi:hypothetical protein